MSDVFVFVLRRMLHRRFWYFVVATFIGALAMWVRSELRDLLFQQASNMVGKRYVV